ncbi:MAG: nuclear transport factor 2 family protein [Actinomycetota bacterium]|nr:nuclear transport factor 2 family protein [Actinomycetota bacterium]
MSREVADKFVEALWKLEVDRDVEALVDIHTQNCSVGNVAVSKTFGGHDGLREFWTDYRKTFDEMKSEFRNVFADDSGHAALGWSTKGTEDGDTISYDGVSILEIEGDKDKRFMVYIDSRTLTKQVVD